MRVILTSVGNAGDVYPFIALGLALKKRGHDAVMLINPIHEREILAAGLSFRPLGSAAQARRLKKMAFIRRPQSGLRQLWRHSVLPNAARLIQALDDECRARKPDWIAYHPASIGAPWICQRHGIRGAVATLVPKAWIEYNTGDVHAVAPPGETPLERLKRRALRLTRPLARHCSDRDLNRIRADFGYPPTDDVFARQFLDSDVNLGMWSSVLRGRLPSDPANGQICGFTWYDGDNENERTNAELQAFLDEGEPPIIVTTGTTVVTAAGNFYEIAAEACRRLGRRGLLLTGSAENRPKRMPPGVRAFDYARFSSAFPRACATVHHGGMGTLGQALRAGKPMTIIPVAWDQFDNAKLARRLKTSLTLDRSTVSAKTLAAALRRMLDKPARLKRAANIGARLKAEDGAMKAALLLERASASSHDPEPMINDE